MTDDRVRVNGEKVATQSDLRALRRKALFWFSLTLVFALMALTGVLMAL